MDEMPQHEEYTPRGYQEYILQRLEGLRGRDVLIELDCGLGKRFITHQIVAERFADARAIIIVHSSSSLAETIQYLRDEYGRLGDCIGELSSRVPSKRRAYVMREKRVVVATPQVLASVLTDDPSLIEPFDMVIINEVDKMVRRHGDSATLVYPWSHLVGLIRNKWVIAMSGTIRDDHAVLTGEQLEIRDELTTLREHLPDLELIAMEDLYQTDVTDYLRPTLLTVVTVTDDHIRAISTVLDELLASTKAEIVAELEEGGNLHLIEGDPRRLYLMIERLPVRDELKGRYTGLLMLRKFVFAMPPKSLVRKFYNDYLQHYFDVAALRRSLPSVSAKVTKVLGLAVRYQKTVVLTSYVEMVRQIEDVLEKAGLHVVTVTGSTRDKGAVLRRFREDPQTRVLVMSPVGERDLDLPQADLMVVCDTINTTKTMYQKFKRTRGGLVVLLAYSGTSEEKKVRRLFERVLERYPWSTAVLGAVDKDGSGVPEK